MPELPEVETIVRQLQRTVQGKIIKEVKIFDIKSWKKKMSPEKISSLQKLKALKVLTVERKAKALLMSLENGHFLLVRFGMTGHFSFAGLKQQKKEKYARVILHFTDGSLLTFHDIRKFGSIRLFSENELRQELQKIGPEPLAKSFTPLLLFQLLQQKKNANLKTTLMDQSVIAGIGNIYAQEAPYHAKIDPQRKAGSVTLQEAKRLHFFIQSTLQKAIAAGGSTVDNYSSLEGAGNFQQQLAVYQQDSCPKKHLLQRIVLGGRGTWYCKECQK